MGMRLESGAGMGTGREERQMSLDVYLTMKGMKPSVDGSGIFVREDGCIVEISRAEWDARFPGREPAVALTNDDTAYEANITHNLNTMASHAGIYDCMWRPDENGIETAAQLIEPLEVGLSLLQSDPERFEALNPSNGWGSYEGLVRFTRNYLEACREYPEAEVRVSR